MTEGTLFNSGILGANFSWWVGQIADDSTWRDNILPGKFEDKNTIPGWGRRYKVRIIGLHDKEETSIPSDQLPWAQVMYPITAGGGQTNSSQTPALRQGNFVFGFFLDGQDQQVPVIMGILGNNAQTALGTKIGNDESNFAATSGYAEGKDPPKGTARPKVTDEGLVTKKPTTPEQSKECASPPSGTKTNQFGLRPDLALSKEQFADAQSARTEADAKGLTGTAKDEFVQKTVASGIKNRCNQASSPSSPSQPGATKENPDAVHELCSADVKREDKYQEKIPLMKPDDKVGSALKCIQTVIDNLTKKLTKALSALQNYIDAVSSGIAFLKNLIANAACEIAKYMKIVFDKIMEYVLKLLNKQLTKVVSAMPSSMRHMFADMKEIITGLILCLYNKITNGLCGLIQGILNKVLNVDDLVKKAKETPTCGPNTPAVPICCAEDLVGEAISASRDEINMANDSILNNVNSFLDDMQNQLAGVSGALSDITALLGNISGGIASALQFENLIPNIFSCELKPNVAVSDFYTFAKGGAGLPDAQLPSAKAVANAAENPTTATAATEIPYAEPSKATSDLDLI